MTKKKYAEALKSPKWLDKRELIKSRDECKCVKCGSKKQLEVHHTYYLSGKMPWEVPDECLITLCRICHRKEHKDKIIPIKDEIFEKQVPNKKHKNKYSNLSKEDEVIQRMYDLIKKDKKLPKPTYEQLIYVPLNKRKKK
jgi:5-methylcytosine-specific restriction endonuclease McrA